MRARCQYREEGGARCAEDAQWHIRGTAVETCTLHLGPMLELMEAAEAGVESLAN